MIELEENTSSPAVIKVIGIGGGGMNAVSRMLSSNLKGVTFLVTNTDEQVLSKSNIETKIQLGSKLTRGMGAGGDPELGARAAEEDKEKLSSVIKGSDMVFVTAGMGGGTGTGAAPIIASIAKEHKCLVVGVVTKPFSFEGKKRAQTAEVGIQELRQNVDTLITINNDSIHKVIDKKTPFKLAFKIVDDILLNAVRGISDIINIPGYINVDFADVRTVMQDSGDAIMGVGEGTGEEKVNTAVEQAINNLLLEDSSITGASAVLLNVTGSSELTMQDYQDVCQRITAEVAPDAQIFSGISEDDSLKDKIRVTVIATGFYKEKHQLNFNLNRKNESNINQTTVKATEELDEQENKENLQSKNEPTSQFSYKDEKMDDYLPSHIVQRIKESKNDKNNQIDDFDIPTYLRRK